MGGISVQKRRESVTRAAIAEFALPGYYGTSVEAVAKPVGVTQPYVLRLFPGKKAIFFAALMRSIEDTRLAFDRAANGVEGGEQALHAMTNAYTRLISTHPRNVPDADAGIRHRGRRRGPG
ncbi:TetR/AcrR family transcriptional regulator [Streptomyces sp. NPDC052236]|uniref:TetR/AcrR family transcriptional regulator n=1 Tax=Streptomyces sp. NPDC052236 TaxID=3365686 RepID=UPI0037D07156